MAQKQKQVKVEQTPEPNEIKRKEKPAGILHGFLVVILSLVIVFAVFAGVFYFAVKNNVGGFAYIVKPQLEHHPVLRWVLPEELQPEDPDDPKYLTEKQLLRKYEEYRAKVKELDESLKKANQTIEELRKNAENTSEAAIVLAENQAVLDNIKAERDKLDQDMKAFAELVAGSDKSAFKEYFEKTDKATAEAIYKEIVTQELLTEQKALQAKPFSLMTPESAASVLAELYAKDKETLIDIFQGLSANASAQILEKMDPKTAAEITKLLADRNLGR